MRIRSLIEREDFYSILNKTLVSITKDKLLCAKLDCDVNQEQNRIVNEFLNFICLKNTPIAAFEGLYQEYSFTSVTWRKPIQKLLAYLSIHRFSRMTLSQRKIKLPFSLPKTTIIIGGNHRVRFYNVESKTMHVVLKAGDNPEFIINEIALRKNHKIDYAPTFIDHGHNWFSEALVEGKPLNRYAKTDWQKELPTRVINKHEKEIVLSNIEWKPYQEYIEGFINQVATYLRGNPQLPDIISAITLMLNQINEIEKIKIPTSPTHGDLQMGNILATEDGNYKIIDWECTANRFFLYDDFVLFSNIRLSINKAETFKSYINDLKNRVLAKPYSQLLLEFIKQENLTMTLILLEEIRFTVFNNFSSKNIDKIEGLEDSILKLIARFKTKNLS